MLLGAIALSGLLLQQSLPLGEKGFLAWFAFVPMLRAVRGKGFIVGFVAGILTVFTGALLAQYGFLYAHPDPGTNDGWLWTGFGLFGFASALVTAMVAEKNAEKRPAWWFAAWAILFESVLLLQLPAHLGLTQYRHHDDGGVSRRNLAGFLSGLVVQLAYCSTRAQTVRRNRRRPRRSSFYHQFHSVARFRGRCNHRCAPSGRKRKWRRRRNAPGGIAP
jgi:hypothetical protein